MTVLAVGGTGQIGSLVVGRLAEQGAGIVVLTREPEKARLAPGVRAAKGDVVDPETIRAALRGVDTLFLLNPVTADELTRALLTLRLVSDVKPKGVVSFSMVNADKLADVPHAAAKHAGELVIEALGFPATILHPNHFFQNDANREALLGKGVYPMPVGRTGAAMVDIRDIADVAALEALKRDRAVGPSPRDLVDMSGPEILTADGIAAIWTDVLGKPVRYAGDDLKAFEQETRKHMPPAMALDVTLMFDAWQRIGVLPTAAAVDRLGAMLGRPLRTYRAFAEETAAAWRS